ncbi:hypothetical protein H0A66_09750 [Alcaligenaceae bacterium]|nr:hypothetical protein [Alcaligenaceae bacterium]
MSRQTMLMVLGLLAVGVAQAAVLPEEAATRLETEAEAFVQTKGYTSVNVDTLADKKYYSTALFPGLKSNGMFAPDASLDPVTKAVLQLDSRENILPRVRYRISYNMGYLPGMPEAWQSYVEVTRFNLGPAVRADLQASIPPEHLGSAASFGVGPHVSWRFVMAPRMGMLSDIVSASRKVLTNAQATALDCLGVPCLSLEDPTGPGSTWHGVATPSLGEPAFSAHHQGLERPARVAQELLTLAAPEGLEATPYRPETPRMVFVVSMNVSGQEEAVHGLLHNIDVMDDAIASVWTQRFQISGAPGDFSQMFIDRKR